MAETTETEAAIVEKLKNLNINSENGSENGQNGSETAQKPKLTKEQAIEKVEKQIDYYVKLFEDPAPTFERKMNELINIPKEVEHSLLIRERADRLFSSIPCELFMRVFEPNHEEYINARPILIHVLGFIVQITSAPVHRKFKPVLPNLVDSICPRGNKVPMTGTIYTDTALMVGMWADQTGDGKNIYNLLRHMTSFCAAQNNELDVGQFLLCIRTLIHKIFQVAPLEDVSATAFDNRGWTVGILAVIRRLLHERQNRFTNDIRKLMWEVISIMTRIGGITWFNMDKTFAKLAIQMNHVEMQMTLQDVDNLDANQFCLHLRILELYTNAICDNEMFGEEGMEVIPHTVGESTRYILAFWVETYLQKIPLPVNLSLSIFHFAVFLFVHEEMTIQEEKVRKHFGAAIMNTAFHVLEQAAEVDLRGEVGTLFADMLDRLSEFEVLVDTVPVFLMKYLDKIRVAEDYEGWKQRVMDCRCCIMDLRGRVDWYSVKTIKEARALLPRFTDPEQHELKQIFEVFDEVPRVN